jgi:hypothetical protein
MFNPPCDVTKMPVSPAPTFCLMLTAASLLLNAPAAQAATALTISPASVTREYSGQTTLNITGLTTAQTVVVERFLDANGNGIIDSTTDTLVQSFRVTDGQVPAIGGVRNLNVPGDNDGATNGQIRVALNFQTFTEVNRGVAKSIYRVSSTAGASLATALFAVTQPVYSQKVIGRVTTSGAQYSFVALLTTDEHSELVAATMTDANGNFTNNIAPGTYRLIALKSGFVFNFQAAPVVTVGAGATVTQNLTLSAATRMISGRVTDLASGAGLPAMQMFAQSTNDLSTLVLSDANGNFTVPVSTGASMWDLSLSDQATAWLGYLEQDNDLTVNTGAGNVSGVAIQLTKGTALFYGRITDDLNNPVAGIRVRADSQTSNATGDGFTDTNGNYTVSVTGGDWFIETDDDTALAARGLVSQGTNSTIAGGQAVRADLVARRVTAHLRGRVVDDTGAPVAQIGFGAGDFMGMFISSDTDASGNFDLGLFGGTWYLQLSRNDAADRGLIGPNLPIDVQDGVTQSNINYVAKRTTAQIVGSVRDNSNNPLANVSVYASATVNNQSYNADGQTDGSGNFQLGVFNGTWQVGVDCSSLNSRGLDCVQNQTVIVSGGNGTVSFVAQPRSPLRIDTVTLANGGVGDTYSAQIDASGGRQPYFWSLAPGSGALPSGLTLNSGSFNATLSGTLQAAGTFSFTVRVSDSDLTTVDRTFSITVASTTLQISTSSLPDGNTGASYAAQLQASGGTLPHAWSLTPGSAPLPPGLGLSSAGGIQGSPSTAGTFNFAVRVTDANAQTADKGLSITIRSSMPAAPIFARPERLPDRQIRLRLSGDNGQTYSIDASADFKSWATLISLPATNNGIEYIDTLAPNLLQRFYRARAGN